MKKRLDRKAYFFLIDSIIALSVLAVGAFLIFTFYATLPARQAPSLLSEDIMDFFAINHIKDIDNPYAGLGGTLWSTEGEPGGLCPGETLVANGENTLLQQIGEFYGKSSGNSCYIDLAEKFIIELTVKSLPTQYTYEFWVHDLVVDTRIYPQTTTPAHDQSKADTQVLIPSKKIVYGILDKDTGDLFGPYDIEVLVWQ